MPRPRPQPHRLTSTSATCAPRSWRGCSPGRAGSRFVVRMEDLDLGHLLTRVRGSASSTDLTALGLDWDGEVVRQSERFDLYRPPSPASSEAGLTYPCYCTRRRDPEAAAPPTAGLPAALPRARAAT